MEKKLKKQTKQNPSELCTKQYNTCKLESQKEIEQNLKKIMAKKSPNLVKNITTSLRNPKEDEHKESTSTHHGQLAKYQE